MRLLLVLVLIVVVVVIGFFALGGTADFNADVNPPNVEVDPGELPDVDVSPAASAEADSG
jgi:hypothetical protein